MRQIYLNNPILSLARELTWSEQVELLPVANQSKKQYLQDSNTFWFLYLV
jgi:hypothetical protein